MLEQDYKALFGALRSDLHYFDYAATTFMPQTVIEKWATYQNTVGVYYGKGNNFLSKTAKEIMRESESRLRLFLGLGDDYQFLYAKNTTEAINLVALSLSNCIRPMDYIMVGPYEHHSNYLPWKYVAKKRNAVFMEMPVDSEGNVDYEYIQKFRQHIKVISVSSVANTNGYALDIDRLAAIMDDNTFLFVDESQKLAHAPITVHDKIAGHYLSSHKMYGPKNIAAAIVKRDLLQQASPVLLGGGMVNTVGFQDTWASGSRKFEAGTIDIGAIYAWAEACIFVEKIGFGVIKSRETHCHQVVCDVLKSNDSIEMVQDGANGVTSLISFSHRGWHAHDLEYLLSRRNIIIRSGNLCSQNSIRKYHNCAINRISFGIGISENDLKQLVNVLKEL
jgi:cysteine desulfurase/selenocysteine lyase